MAVAVLKPPAPPRLSNSKTSDMSLFISSTKHHACFWQVLQPSRALALVCCLYNAPQVCQTGACLTSPREAACKPLAGSRSVKPAGSSFGVSEIGSDGEVAEMKEIDHHPC